MKTKDVDYKSTVKSSIILFLSYVILLGFILGLVTIIVKCALYNVKSLGLSITLSCMSAIIIYFLIHFSCKSSILETFKNNSISQDNSAKFIKKMNLFFTICIIFSVVLSVSYLLIDRYIYTNAISQTHEKYDFISTELSNNIANTIHEEYTNSLLNKISSTIIIELSCVISFLSLMNYQERLLSKYNKGHA